MGKQQGRQCAQSQQENAWEDGGVSRSDGLQIREP